MSRAPAAHPDVFAAAQQVRLKRPMPKRLGSADAKAPQGTAASSEPGVTDASRCAKPKGLCTGRLSRGRSRGSSSRWPAGSASANPVVKTGRSCRACCSMNSRPLAPFQSSACSAFTPTKRTLHRRPVQQLRALAGPGTAEQVAQGWFQLGVAELVAAGEQLLRDYPLVRFGDLAGAFRAEQEPGAEAGDR